MNVVHSLRMVRSVAISSVALGFLPGAGMGHAEQTLLNRPAPQFARTDVQGTRIDLVQYRGKVVLLNFWATWCAPCRIEMPRFVQWQRQYGPRGFQIIGVSIDDSEAPVRPFVARMRLDYPVVMGNAKLGDLYGGVYGVPVTFLIDRHGVVRARFDGGSDTSRIKAEMLKVLAAR
jgi:cytochrome c biogenesis protein CcmG, thiol:disulfide interchange protein DsbE